MSQDNVLICGDRRFSLGEKTLVMGILNVTPDSFSDGACFFETEKAIDHGQKLIDDGADIVDIGGLSTAPNRKPVSVDEELRRVIPVIEGLYKKGISAICVDTMSSEVASRALDAKASWINDQSAALFDNKMASVMARADAVVLMHNNKGRPTGVDAGETMIYNDILLSLQIFFKERIDAVVKSGVDQQKIVVDPGIGFGKGLKDSLTIINGMHAFNDFGSKFSLIGLSRKSFLEKITGIKEAQERDFATLGGHASAIFSGASILRTHNVRASVEMVRVIDSCRSLSHEDLYQTRR